MINIESILFMDLQRRPEKPCPVCGSCVYPPSYFCIRCERRKLHDPG